MIKHYSLVGKLVNHGQFFVTLSPEQPYLELKFWSKQLLGFHFKNSLILQSNAISNLKFRGK
jgi:hypothetical protein